MRPAASAHLQALGPAAGRSRRAAGAAARRPARGGTRSQSWRCWRWCWCGLGLACAGARREACGVRRVRPAAAVARMARERTLTRRVALGAPPARP